MNTSQAARLVAAREIRERVRSGVFIATTIGSIVITVGLVVAPTVLSSLFGVRTYTIGVVGTPSPAVDTALRVVIPEIGPDVEVEKVASRQQAETALRDGTIDLAVLPDPRILVKTEPAEGDFGVLSRLVRVLSLAPVATGTPLPVEGLEPPRSDASRRPITLYGIAIIYAFILMYGSWISGGVAEEKSSRVVEVLLSAVRPTELLLGKVMGVGAVALLQGTLILGSGLAAGRAIDASWAGAGTLGDAVVILGWFAIAYAFYCALYAVAGALTSSQNDSQSAIFPLMAPLIIAFMVSTSAIGGEETPLLLLFSFLPPTAPITMPMRVTIGTAPAWQAWLSAGGVVLATVFVFRVAAGVYARSLLRTGAKVKLREVIRAGN